MKTPKSHSQSVSFLDFWCLITDNLGDAYSSIDPQTKTAQQLFSDFNDQLGLLKQVISDSYTLNKCHHLHSHIDINSVLDILGTKAFDLQVKQADDLLDMELLEEVCWLVCQHFGQLIVMPKIKNSNQKLGPTEAKVYSLIKTKTRIANNKL